MNIRQMTIQQLVDELASSAESYVYETGNEKSWREVKDIKRELIHRLAALNLVESPNYLVVRESRGERVFFSTLPTRRGAEISLASYVDDERKRLTLAGVQWDEASYWNGEFLSLELKCFKDIGLDKITYTIKYSVEEEE